MDFSKWLGDERLLANLIGIHIILAVLLTVSMILRKLLKNSGEHFIRWTGLHWLDGISREAVKGLRSMLFWTTVSLMIFSVVATAVYHASGHDVRKDARDGYEQLSTAHLVTFGTMLGKLVLLTLAMGIIFRLI